jgi:hypothetical protein
LWWLHYLGQHGTGWLDRWPIHHFGIINRFHKQKKTDSTQNRYCGRGVGKNWDWKNEFGEKKNSMRQRMVDAATQRSLTS